MESIERLKDVSQEITTFKTQYPDGVVIIRGATATGKSSLSVKLAEHFPIEIISSDSRQIFKYMDIGTDKVSAEVREKIPHHLIDFLNPNERFTAQQRKDGAEKSITNILSNQKIPIIVGGTGLYIDTLYKNFSMPEIAPDFTLRSELEEKEAKIPGTLHTLLQQIDPEEAKKIHPHSGRFLIRALEIYYKTGITKTASIGQLPVKWPLLMIGLQRDVADSNRRIDKRIEEMFEQGLIEEVKHLLSLGYTKDLQAMNGIGYKETLQFLDGKLDFAMLKERIKISTHQFAKRQRTWFRRYINESIENPKDRVVYRNFFLT